MFLDTLEKQEQLELVLNMGQNQINTWRDFRAWTIIGW